MNTRVVDFSKLRNKGTSVGNLEDLHYTFVQNVSHELRTPLCILMGYAELLNDGELGELAPQQLEAMNLIVSRAEQLQLIVNRISSLLALQAHMTISQPVSLASVVAQMVESQRQKATQAGVEFSLRLAPELPEVVGDLYMLQEAVECLVENAIKFTPNGGRVEVRLDKDGDQVTISVVDTGIGMDEEELAQICRPFYQVDDSMTRRFGGLGLGLTLVYKVVEIHGGRIEVQSSPGEGSTFTIKLPAFVTPAVAGEDTGAHMQRVLIVDDEEYVAFTLQEGLERLPNCEIAIAQSGEEALALFEETPFDLLITDYRMPDMNGVALAARVRERFPHTGVIMVTGFSNYLVQEPAFTQNIQRVFNKPVRLAEIRDAALESLQACAANGN